LWKETSNLDRFVASLKESGEVRNFPASFITRTGEEIHAIISARTLVLDGEMCVLSITRDITQLVIARHALEQAHRELEQAYDATIEGWALALELRDQETLGHTRRVTELAVRFGKRLGLSEDELKILRRGVLLHDIGKMAIPDDILHKPGPLTDDEWAVMRLHPVYARQMLQHIEYLKPALVIPYSHHERWDGSGYPEGLKGEEIPLLARLFAIVDVWDSLCHDRVYRQGMGRDASLNYLRENAGKLFDPVLVQIFIEMIAEDLKANK
jgi:HD-GYP domain-containing protein (c-di-GMP phosphodiesterase class II)